MWAPRWSIIPASTRSPSLAPPLSVAASSEELAGTGRKITLELGGKGANIIFEDAAQDQAVEGIINGIFFNQGQVCCAGSRLLVQESIADEFIERLKQRIETLRVGDPMDKNTDVGAINSEAQLGRITALMDAGIAEALNCGRPRARCRRMATSPPRSSPTPRHRCGLRARIFGPVLTTMTFRPRMKPSRRPTTARTACRPACGRRRARGPWVWRLRSGVIWDNTQPVRSDG